MNVAKLDLCRTLWELSGWDSEEYPMWKIPPKVGKGYTPEVVWSSEDMPGSAWGLLPAYDLGYLLRKLPEGSHLIKAYSLGTNKTSYNISLKTERPLPVKMFLLDADTPEDALCKLAIELFKQKVLTR